MTNLSRDSARINFNTKPDHLIHKTFASMPQSTQFVTNANPSVELKPSSPCKRWHFPQQCLFEPHRCKQCRKAGLKESYCPQASFSTPESSANNIRWTNQGKKSANYKPKSKYLRSNGLLIAFYIGSRLNQKYVNLEIIWNQFRL
ncbi:unnamed protein product [Hymenolepis diminuta]|uniref:Uncharacterized protein n=1 Tax=Hymenolepis diminuta TaxID=6216 RepID=A0A564YU84_HYMDI|nr:unnamed protein product [Hymenolepis diminuta]